MEYLFVDELEADSIEVENLDDTERGDNGFGSSDNNLKEK
jgi:dUTPase